MANTSTVIGDAVAAIVTAMRARAGYRSPWDQDTPGIPVYHSAEIGLFGESVQGVPVLLVVADQGDPEADSPDVAQSGQRPATIGTRRARQETATIRCRAIAQTGDVGEGVVQAQWAAALSVVDAVDAELRADPSGVGPTLGLEPAYRSVVAQVAQVTSVRPYLAGGTVVEVPFEVEVSARL